MPATRARASERRQGGAPALPGLEGRDLLQHADHRAQDVAQRFHLLEDVMLAAWLLVTRVSWSDTPRQGWLRAVKITLSPEPSDGAAPGHVLGLGAPSN